MAREKSDYKINGLNGMTVIGIAVDIIIRAGYNDHTRLARRSFQTTSGQLVTP